MVTINIISPSTEIFLIFYSYTLIIRKSIHLNRMLLSLASFL